MFSRNLWGSYRAIEGCISVVLGYPDVGCNLTRNPDRLVTGARSRADPTTAMANQVRVDVLVCIYIDMYVHIHIYTYMQVTVVSVYIYMRYIPHIKKILGNTPRRPKTAKANHKRKLNKNHLISWASRLVGARAP